MWGIGFGLEHIGMAALRRPILFSLLTLALIVAAATQLLHLKFEGDITVVLPDDSAAIRDFKTQKSEFRDFARDVTILVQSDRLISASGLEDLRSLQLELAVTDGVDNVVSIFSLPNPDPQTGEIGSFFPDPIPDDETAKKRAAELLAEYPQAASLLAIERNTAVVLATLSEWDDISRPGPYSALKKAAEAARPKDFKLSFTGLTPISVTIVTALVTDQMRLTVIGLLLGAAIAFLVFRSLWAALICAVPPALTAIWVLAMFGVTGLPVNYLTTVLPTLALILAFADGIMLYYRWHSTNADSPDLLGNLRQAVIRVGPATSLTSITTFLAFSSFYFAHGDALKNFALLGMAAVALAFLAVILGLPLVGYWCLKAGRMRPTAVRRPLFSGLGKSVASFVWPRAGRIALIGLVLALMLSVLHFLVRSEYRLTDYLPLGSDTRQAEAMANDIFGGRSLLFLSIPAIEPGTPFSAGNLRRLQQIEDAILPVIDATRIVSPLEFARKVKTADALAKIDEQFQKATSQSRANYLSSDGERLLMSLRIPSDQSIHETIRLVGQLRSQLASLPYGNGVVVTGFDVLMGAEFTSLISQLRSSLLIAIFLGIAVIGMATRSPWLAIACATPNLLPIFAVETIIWYRGGGINMSEVIALTIAFGIAVDNAVHVINVREGIRQAGNDGDDALRLAVVEAGPALMASTTIICVSSLVTQISILPMVPVVGGLIIATLLVALASNLLILPANLIALARFGRQP